MPEQKHSTEPPPQSALLDLEDFGTPGTGVAFGQDPPLTPGSVAPGGIIDLVLAITNVKVDRENGEPDSGLRESANQLLGGRMETGEALRLLLGDFLLREKNLGYLKWKKAALTQLNRYISEIDMLINRQLNACLHHPQFQKLEASWRGVKMLVDRCPAETANRVQIKLLNVSWREIARDFERASDFDSSNLFEKIYDQEFGTPGGKPYGVIIGDYEIRPRPTVDHPFDDIKILEQIAGVAAAAFCPFVCSVSPSIFGVNRFAALQSMNQLERLFELKDFVKWRAFRDKDDSRFVGLTLPRILMRPPHAPESTLGFRFTEDVSDPSGDSYLWGNASFGWATVLINSFIRTGWLADICGVDREQVGGGLLENLSSVDFGTDRPEVAVRSSSDLIVTDSQEAELSKLGFLPMASAHSTKKLVFYNSQSVQKPVNYQSPSATANARISSRLHYVLCASRFAHYIKVIARDKIGSGMEAEKLETFLNNWLRIYISPDDSAKLEIKRQRPLREGRVEVTRVPGMPGSYNCRIFLLPHYQLEELSTAMSLTTTVRKSQ